MTGPDPRYTQNIRSASTALTDPDAKIRRRRTERGSGEASARPWGAVRHFGIRTPVTVTLEYVGGSEPWLKVSYYQGHFFVCGTGELLALIERLQRGGFPIKTRTEGKKKRRR